MNWQSSTQNLHLLIQAPSESCCRNPWNSCRTRSRSWITLFHSYTLSVSKSKPQVKSCQSYPSVLGGTVEKTYHKGSLLEHLMGRTVSPLSGEWQPCPELYCLICILASPYFVFLPCGGGGGGNQCEKTKVTFPQTVAYSYIPRVHCFLVLKSQHHNLRETDDCERVIQALIGEPRIQATDVF